MLIKNRYLKVPLDVCEDVSESRPVIKSDPNRPVIDRISGIPLQFKERVTTKKRRKKKKQFAYYLFRANKEVLDSRGPVPVITGRNKDDGESLTKLQRVFM